VGDPCGRPILVVVWVAADKKTTVPRETTKMSSLAEMTQEMLFSL